jgi:hypothetical protein
VTLLTHEQAAAHMGVCEKTLRSLRQQGLIPYVAVTKRKKLYRVEDLDAYLAGQVTREVYQPTQRRGSRKRLSAPGNVLSFTARRRERLAAGGR